MTDRRRHLTAAVSMAFAIGFVLCGYELVRTAANTLFKAAYGADNLPVVMALSPVAIVALLYGYGFLLSRLGPRRTLLATTLLSGAAIAVCWAGIRVGWRPASGIVYVLKEGYIVLLIEQYWSFLNSTLGVPAAKALNGPIVGVSSLGSVAGGWLLFACAKPLGTSAMLLLSAAFAIPAALVSDYGYAACGEPAPATAERADRAPADPLNLGLFRSSRLLACLFALVLVTQVVSTVLDLNFQTILQEKIPDMDAQTAYSGRFFALLNGGAALLQFVAAPLLLRYVSLRRIHLALPVAYLVGAAGILLAPSLAMAGLAFALFKMFDYSIFRSAKEVLYIPLSFDARYRAKEVIDVFGYRFGKAGASFGILAGKAAGIVFLPLYGWIAMIAAGAWLWLAALIFRQPDVAAVSGRPVADPGGAA